VWVDEAEELGYFKNNGVGHGRNARLMEKPTDTGRDEVWRARLMEKPNDTGREEVWRARLMDKVDWVGSELRMIKMLIGVFCLIELFKMLLYCAKSM